MFLTTDEIKELTDRVQYQAQAKMLRTLGMTFKIRSDGSLLVLRAHVERELGGTPHVNAKVKGFQPNWDGIHA
ncbi:hypothetical protein AAKU55_005602 [Oxalobacteraceae bacterium GrIS 1.11]